MGVVNLPSGRPTMQLTGGALKRLQSLTPKGYEARIDLTIADEGPMAVAFVVISAGRSRSRRGSPATGAGLKRRTSGAAVQAPKYAGTKRGRWHAAGLAHALRAIGLTS